MDKRDLNSKQEILKRLLKQIRLEAGLTQRAVAESLGHPQSYVSKYEIGERRLDIVEVQLICKSVGISLAEFATRFERLCDEA